MTVTLKMILSGLDMKEVPLNSLPATIYGLVIPSFCLYIAFAIYSSSNLLSLGKYSYRKLYSLILYLLVVPKWIGGKSVISCIIERHILF
jgi:hypothetical protein